MRFAEARRAWLRAEVEAERLGPGARSADGRTAAEWKAEAERQNERGNRLQPETDLGDAPRDDADGLGPASATVELGGRGPYLILSGAGWEGCLTLSQAQRLVPLIQALELAGLGPLEA